MGAYRPGTKEMAGALGTRNEQMGTICRERAENLQPNMDFDLLPKENKAENG